MTNMTETIKSPTTGEYHSQALWVRYQLFSKLAFRLNEIGESHFWDICLKDQWYIDHEKELKEECAEPFNDEELLQLMILTMDGIKAMEVEEATKVKTNGNSKN